MKKEDRLIDTLNRGEASRLFEGYPIHIIGENENLRLRDKLSLIVKTLHSINEKDKEILSEIMNVDDILDISMFLSEKLWLLRKQKQNET